MTVKELREQLSNFPDDKEIIIRYDYIDNGIPWIGIANNIKIYENFSGNMIIQGVKNNA